MRKVTLAAQPRARPASASNVASADSSRTLPAQESSIAPSTRRSARLAPLATDSTTMSAGTPRSAARKSDRPMGYVRNARKDISIRVTGASRTSSEMTDAMCWTQPRAV